MVLELHYFQMLELVWHYCRFQMSELRHSYCQRKMLGRLSWVALPQAQELLIQKKMLALKRVELPAQVQRVLLQSQRMMKVRYYQMKNQECLLEQQQEPASQIQT
jgi:hypothetical protein